MSDILSNEELDTLLSAVDVGDVPTGAGQMQARQKRVSSYDFRKPNRFSRDQLRVLQYMHKNAAQLMSSDLSSMLRIGVEVQLVSIGQITYDAFSASLADPICINILSLDPLEQLGVLAIDLPLAFAIMERMLGGPGQIPSVTRPLTMLEETIVSQAIELILRDLNQSWESLVPLKLKVERREMSSGFVHVVPGPEIVLLVTLSVGGQLASGEMKFCIPYVSLEPIMHNLGTEHMTIKSGKERPTDRLYIEQHLNRLPLELSAVLGRTELSIGELLSLDPGNVLLLDAEADDPIVCEVQEQPKLLGHAGTKGRHVAIQVEEVFDLVPHPAHTQAQPPKPDTDANPAR